MISVWFCRQPHPFNAVVLIVLLLMPFNRLVNKRMVRRLQAETNSNAEAEMKTQEQSEKKPPEEDEDAQLPICL